MGDFKVTFRREVILIDQYTTTIAAEDQQEAFNQAARLSANFDRNPPEADSNPPSSTPNSWYMYEISEQIEETE